MLRVVAPALFLSLATAPLAAQAAHQGHAKESASVAALTQTWEMFTNYFTQAAQDMPEDKYGYRPTPEVRTFGEIVGHVAGAQNMICAIALGQTPPAEDAVEKTAKTKAALVEALKASTANCAKAYKQTDAATQAPAELFGMKVTRFHALSLNAAHNAEHYGNLVTYLRINGMVPPSSRQGGM